MDTLLKIGLQFTLYSFSEIVTNRKPSWDGGQSIGIP